MIEMGKKLASGKSIILFDYQDEKLLRLLCETIEKHNNSNVIVYHAVRQHSEYAYAECISKEQLKEMRDMYRLYDFSDKVRVISKEMQYGSMFNYLDSGFLSSEEMVEALLHDI